MLATLTDTRFLIGVAVGFFLVPRVVKFAGGKLGSLGGGSKPATA